MARYLLPTSTTSTPYLFSPPIFATGVPSTNTPTITRIMGRSGRVSRSWMEKGWIISRTKITATFKSTSIRQATPSAEDTSSTYYSKYWNTPSSPPKRNSSSTPSQSRSNKIRRTPSAMPALLPSHKAEAVIMATSILWAYTFICHPL